MGDLTEHPGAVPMHRLGQIRHGRNDPVLSRAQLPERGNRIGGNRRRAADHRQRHAPFRLLLVIQAIAFGGQRIETISRRVRRADDAIAQLQMADAQWLEQVSWLMRSVHLVLEGREEPADPRPASRNEPAPRALLRHDRAR